MLPAGSTVNVGVGRGSVVDMIVQAQTSFDTITLLQRHRFTQQRCHVWALRLRWITTLRRAAILLPAVFYSL